MGISSERMQYSYHQVGRIHHHNPWVPVIPAGDSKRKLGDVWPPARAERWRSFGATARNDGLCDAFRSAIIARRRAASSGAR
jgi:hypothetical protein